MKPVKREDLPEEGVNKIIEELQKLHPGMEVKFAGDEEEESGEEDIELGIFLAALKGKHERTLGEGVCLDCGKKVPCNWPPDEGEFPEDWSMFFGMGEGGEEELQFIVCPECDAIEGSQEVKL